MAATGMVNSIGARMAQAGGARGYASPVDAPQADYAYEMAASNLRFGEGATREVGMDFKNLGAKKVGVFTDANSKLRSWAGAGLGLAAER